MKINIIVPFVGLTGGIRVIFLYGNHLTEQGHDVKFYYPIKAYKFNNKINKRIRFALANIKHYVRKVRWFDCKFDLELVPVIKDKYLRDADISIATAWPTAYDLYKLSESKGKKVYFIQDYEVWSGDKEDVDGTYKLPLDRITITKNLDELLKDKFNVKSHVIYNGIDKDEFIKTGKVNKETINVTMLYNMAENKGTQEGIDLLKELKDKYNINVTLFGFKKGDNVPNDFEFYENPSREDLLNLYRNSEIYLFPSKRESWGLPVIEAMANKCAVVGNKVGCLDEIGVDGENSMLVEGINYDELKMKVETLINDRELLKRIQDNGFEEVKNLTWENSFRKFEQHLKELL